MIRKAKLKDVNAILRLLNSAEELKQIKDYVYPREYVTVFLKNPNNFIFVYEDNKKILGVICGEIWKDRGSVYISNIVVNNKNREKGIAAKLYHYLENYCKKNKIKLINAFAKVNNKRIHKFNEKMGFKKGEAFYYFEKKL